MLNLFNKKIIISVLLASSSFPLILLFNNNYSTEGINFLMLPNYNGQADMMLSLQVYPDYYPYQFKQQKLYDYLSNISEYITSNENVSAQKKQLAEKLPKRLQTLIGNIKTFGPSLWNKDLYDTGTVYRNDQFWSTMNTKYLLIEQFIADDYMNIFDGVNILPTHEELIVTNYRVARDPYSIFSKDVFDFFNQKQKSKLSNTSFKNLKSTITKNSIGAKLYEYYEKYSKISPNSLYRFSKFIDFWNKHLEEINKEFLCSDHRINLEDFFTLVKDDEKIFYIGNDDIDKHLAKQYTDSVFSSEEKSLLNKWHKEINSNEDWSSNYLKKSKTTTSAIKSTSALKDFHHPALEHQTINGSAPLSEGSQKEVMVYLHQFASTFRQMSLSKNFDKNFGDDPRKPFVSKASLNAKLIAKNYKERIKNIREYFQKLDVIDNSFNPDNDIYKNAKSKTLAIVTHTPNGLGSGNSSIQSISKFPFIYRDIGFKQVVPNFFNKKVTQQSHNNDAHDHSHDHDHDSHGHSQVDYSIHSYHTHDSSDYTHDLEDTFSVDDNGWWWNIGNTNIETNNLKHFEGTSDSVILLATEDDWNLLSGENNRKISALSNLFKKENAFKYEYQKINALKYPLSYQKYNLWNEGLRSPLALNLLLDNLVEIIKNQYFKEDNDYNDEYQKAQDWGNYWSDNFVNGTNYRG